MKEKTHKKFTVKTKEKVVNIDLSQKNLYSPTVGKEI